MSDQGVSGESCGSDSVLGKNERAKTAALQTGRTHQHVQHACFCHDKTEACERARSDSRAWW